MIIRKIWKIVHITGIYNDKRPEKFETHTIYWKQIRQRKIARKQMKPIFYKWMAGEGTK